MIAIEQGSSADFREVVLQEAGSDQKAVKKPLQTTYIKLLERADRMFDVVEIGKCDVREKIAYFTCRVKHPATQQVKTAEIAIFGDENGARIAVGGHYFNAQNPDAALEILPDDPTLFA